MRHWAVLFLVVMTTCLSTRVEAAEAECEPAALDRLATEDYETAVWSSLRRFRELKDTCEPGSGTYWYYLAQLESFVGNHAAALSHVDPAFRQDSPRDFPSSITSVAATEYVIDRARDHRIVMVNERHHASSDRLLTMELLAPLAEQGFRYLAIEAGWSGDPINTRGYPVAETGYYVNDVVFAEVVRSAIELGYRIIAYEIEQEQRTAADQVGEMNRQEERDWWQAKNIASRVFDIDSNAKLLVHAGYDHIRESRTDTWAPMAHFLREFTGFDPLTIEQTVYSERSRPELEHPLRTRARELDLLGEAAIVLVDSEGQPIRPHKAVDLAVFGVSTRYANGRPTWMGMGGRRQAMNFDTPECAARTCIVEARRVDFTNEVPLDRIEVTGAERTTLYLPAGEDIVVHVMGLDRSTLVTRNLYVPNP